METYTYREWNYVCFGFINMEFPIPVKVGRQMPKVLTETCDGYSAIRVKPKPAYRRTARRGINEVALI